ncbi:MAG: oligoendopeptidase F family protein [Myxococcales bacterium]|nr:oligoendopeptidase F family protein [Myxococcales bacterium]
MVRGEEGRRPHPNLRFPRSIDGHARCAADERLQVAQRLASSLDEATSWFEPELLRLDPQRLESTMKSNPSLAPYSYFLKNILRRKEHTLSPDAEAVLARTTILEQAPSDIYTVLTTSDLAWPEVTIDERPVRVDRAGYAVLRDSRDRSVRKLAFETFFGTFQAYEASVGRILASEVASNLFQAESRGYANVLAWALAGDNIPEEVYRTLVREVNAALPVLHRYFRLRARMLGIEDLRYHDMYPALVEMEENFDLETSRELTLAALAPLGPEYIAELTRATEQRWQHVYPSPTKRGGAFMEGGAYDVHPYILLNHNDSFDSLSTYAHEWGHAVHSILANRAQPWPTSQYSTFLAEVASIGNELFLLDHLLKQASTREERLFFLGQELELFRTTFFRQAMFAEFELAIHEEVQSGGALSGARLTAIYGDLLTK